ncbi:MAG TPA: tetratricopeptide repeat protein [Longimicrobiales bacterium]|nr:tetratricopeptide repeat protein [Longimicrobiales bacterium]
MMEPDRVLRPLYEAAPAIEQLETYASPAALQDALRGTWHAVDRTLRLLLRHDPGADDSLRLSALSETMTLDDVITALRRRDIITLYLAGRIHEFGQALARSQTTGVLAADADRALAVVQALETEIGAAARAGSGFERPDAATRPAERAEPDEHLAVPEASTGARRGLPRRTAVIAGAAVVVIAAATAAVLIAARQSEMEKGIAAFRMGSAGQAEQHFRVAAERDAGNVNARLYLGRILRTQDRHDEAARVLQDAVRIAPRDAAVRRELGQLFLALGRPTSAVEQFRVAVELDAEEPLGWVGLVTALRRADDPSADEWLRRAPASAQAMFRDSPR